MSTALQYVGQRSGLKVIPERNNELVFESEEVLFSPIEKEFPLQYAKLEAFEVHFPKISQKWRDLNNRALQLKEDNQNNRLNNDELEEVASSLKELSKTAKSKLVDIRIYHKIGTKEFHYDKKCPICRKF